MLLFLFGADTYRSREKLNDIIGKYAADIKKGAVELKKFDTADLDFFELKDTVETTSLFCSKKIIVIRGACSAEENLKGKLEGYLPVLEKSKDLIIFIDEKTDGRDKFFKDLKKAAKSQEFDILEPLEVKKWIDEKIKNLSLKMKIAIAIKPDAKEALVNFVGADLWQLSAELEKLILYKINGGAEEKIVIELADLEILVKAQLRPYIFKTLDAVAAKNKKEALRLLHEHLSGRENEFYILTMFVWQMRNLIRIKDLLDRGLASSAIAQKTKISPFVVGKNLLFLKKVALADLKSIYYYLLELEVAMKTGKIDSSLALDMFIFKFTPLP